jgi:hypothetical protein
VNSRLAFYVEILRSIRLNTPRFFTLTALYMMKMTLRAIYFEENTSLG